MNTQNPLSATVTGLVVEQLLTYIQERRLGDGAELPTEQELTGLLGVSRGALREALSYLKALGIVTSRRGSGFRVNAPDLVPVLTQMIRHLVRTHEVDLRRIYAHIRCLELGCVWDAILRATEEQLAEIERRRAAYETAAREEPVDPRAVNLAEIGFHKALMASSGCRTLLAINAVLYDYFEVRFNNPASFMRETLEEKIREQRMLADAYTARAPENAYFAMRRHLRWGEEPEYQF